MIKKSWFILLCLIAFLAVGCSKEPVEDIYTVPPDLPMPVADDDQHAPSSSEKPLPPAKEINRGDEVFDYAGWEINVIGPETVMLIGEGWVYDSMAVLASTQWSDPQNEEAKIIFSYYTGGRLYGVDIRPKEAIWEDYRPIIEKGGDVEYGIYNSKYLAEAYYVKFAEDGYDHIALYFDFVPQDAWAEITDNPRTPDSLIFEKRIGTGSPKCTLTEEAFWKAAQSIFHAKDYNENAGLYEWIPYIPEIDWANIWEGPGQGIVM